VTSRLVPRRREAAIDREAGGTAMANLHAIAGADVLPADIVVKQIGPADLKEALRKGYEDFMAMPTHLAFLGMFYPFFGVALGALTFSSNALPLLFPLVSGFALVGPLAAIGLYELSRRRELGLESTWDHAFDVLRSPALPSILALGAVLMVILVAWVASAQALYEGLYGETPPESYLGFLWEVLTTSRGWTLIVLGHAVGLLFAAVSFSISVISFPLMLDRNVGVGPAIMTSLQAVRTNPRTMAVWAMIIAVALMVGSAPLLVGLAVAMPIISHASWHLYRRTIEPAQAASPRSARRSDPA
jgi:uncharacterized membrane protein